MECLRLIVQDIDFSRNEILVRDGKGAKDRVTMLPESVKTSFQHHLKKVKKIHERDLAKGWGRVQMPMALDRKYPNAPGEWRWQWVFPQENRWKNTKTGEQGRHHAHESIIQKAVAGAVRKSLSPNVPPATPFGIPLRRIFWKGATTFGQSRSSSAIRT